MTAAILTDVTKCIGCQKCVEACVETNGPAGSYNYVPGDVPAIQDSPDGLSARRWTSVVSMPGNHYVRKQCRHCLEPACVSACPVGAMQHTEEGPIIYNRERCMGCRYCMMACPYNIPRYEWDKPIPYINKCTLCYSTRLQKGEIPACVEACPTGATIFGERDEMLAEAARRIDAEPDRYINHIYGEHEVGGTSVLYISNVPLDNIFGFAQKPPQEEPLPDLTWRVLKHTPTIAFGMTALMAGTYWILERRVRLARERAAKKSGQEPAGAESEGKEAGDEYDE